MNQSCLEASGRREKRGKTTKPNIISLANHNTRNKTGALAGADSGNVPGHHWFWF